MTCHLKVGVDGVKLFGVLWQLSPDVLQADEDALEVGPGALHLEPDGDDRVRRWPVSSASWRPAPASSPRTWRSSCSTAGPETDEVVGNALTWSHAQMSTHTSVHN